MYSVTKATRAWGSMFLLLACFLSSTLLWAVAETVRLRIRITTGNAFLANRNESIKPPTTFRGWHPRSRFRDLGVSPDAESSLPFARADGFLGFGGAGGGDF